MQDAPTPGGMTITDDGGSKDVVGLDEFHTAFSKLTDKQRLYVENRLLGLNQTASARAAGYAEGSCTSIGHQLEKNPVIKNVLILASKQALQKMSIGREDVLKGLMDAVDTASTATELVAAWREIGKLIGAYEPEKVEHTHKLEDISREKLAMMSDAELLTHAGDAEFRLTDDDIIEGEFEEIVEPSTEDYVPSDIEPEPIDYGEDNG